jgi:predicted amidohydrolase
VAFGAGLALPVRAEQTGNSTVGTATGTGGAAEAAGEKSARRTLVRRKATVSLVSYETVDPSETNRLDKTVEQMSDNVAQAASVGSDMVAFPEAVARLGASNIWEFEDMDAPTVSAMRKAAEKNSIYVVCPLPMMENGIRRNSSVLIDRGGGIAGVYHKNFPTHGELNVGIIPGTEAPVFETDFGRVGLSICFDLNYWEVGSSLCANKAELVIWSSMWPGERMLTKWALEFGFYIGAVYSGRSTFVDVAGRKIITRNSKISRKAGSAPVVTATIDMDRRLLHHDFNIGRLRRLYEKYGTSAAYCEWMPEECLVVFASQMPEVSTDQLIEEFGLETMRDYLARARRDRQLALKGQYKPPSKS